MATIDDIKTYLKNGTNPKALDDLHEKGDLYKKASRHGASLDKLGKFDEFYETLEGGKHSKVFNETKEMAEELKQLKEMKADFAAEGPASKYTDRQIASLEKKIASRSKQVHRGIEQMMTMNGKVTAAIAEDTQKLYVEIDKAFAEEKKTIKGTYDTAVGKTGATAADKEAAKEAFKDSEAELIARRDEIKTAIKDARAEKAAFHAEFSKSLTDLGKEIETTTGIKPGASFVEKVAGKEAGAAAKEAGGLKGLVMKNPLVSLAVAGFAGAALVAAMGGSSKEASR